MRRRVPPIRTHDVRVRTYTGKPTYFDQILTSLEDRVHRVRAGDAGRGAARHPVAALSPTFNAAINPLIQIFKPVSPLAWLPDRHDGRERALRDRRADCSRNRS